MYIIRFYSISNSNIQNSNNAQLVSYLNTITSSMPSGVSESAGLLQRQHKTLSDAILDDDREQSEVSDCCTS